MIGTIKVGTENFDVLIDELKKIKKSFDAPNLQVYRARKFKEFTEKFVSSGAAGLLPISSATRILTGEHDPMYLTGALIGKMKVQAVKGSGGNAADVGYWGDMGKVPGKDITWNRLAMLHHTGYRIPLFGEKGRKVRAWLAMNGVNLIGTMGKTDQNDNRNKSDGKWIHVRPRPFMNVSFNEYVKRDMDSKAVEEYFKNIDSKTEE